MFSNVCLEALSLFFPKQSWSGRFLLQNVLGRLKPQLSGETPTQIELTIDNLFEWKTEMKDKSQLNSDGVTLGQ